MKSSLKLVSYLSVLSSVFVIESAQAQQNCPTLTKPELRQLCRWRWLKKIPLLKIQAGEVTTKEGITLVNTLGTCKQLDSIRAFFTNDPNKTYKGEREKSPADRSKDICTYTLETSTIGKKSDEKNTNKAFTIRKKPEKIGFEATFPPEPVKKIIGVNIMIGPGKAEVGIKKPQAPAPAKKVMPPPVKVPMPPPIKAESTEKAAQRLPLPAPKPPMMSAGERERLLQQRQKALEAAEAAQ